MLVPQLTVPDDLRQLHLDFHTPDFVKVAEKFDAAQFFDTLENAEVNSVTAFALCHHGNSYFNTKIGRRHPGLSFDLFGAMAEEAAKRSFPLMAYFSMNVNEAQALLHPEWSSLRSDGSPMDSQILQDGSELFWTWLCPNRGPLIDDFFFPHIGELLDNYPVGGIFVDMAGYLPGSCHCPVCTGEMKARGLDPSDMTHHSAFNNDTIQKIARGLRSMMDAKRPGMRLEMGSFNDFGQAHKGIGVVSDFYVESLAFQTGWQHLQVASRYFRRQGIPTLGMTGRFLKNWGDFGTVGSPRQQKVQLSMHLMAGVASCIGDHLPADGSLEPGVYDAIGAGFRFIKPRQPFCVNMIPAKEAAILVAQGEGANAATMNADGAFAGALDAYKGAAKMMTELHCQYDIVADNEDLEGYGLLFVTHGCFGTDFVRRVEGFLRSGGVLVASGCGLSSADAAVCGMWQRLIGVENFSLSEHQGEFYKAVDHRLLTPDHPRMAHYVHARAIDAEFRRDAEVLAEDWRSPCVRSRERHYGHFHGPAAVNSGPAAAFRSIGGGTAVLIRPQIFAAYLQTGYYVHRMVVRDLLNAFLPVEKRVLRTNAPTLVELSVGEKDGRIALQALPFITDRRDRQSFESVCDDPITLRGIWVELPNAVGYTKASDPISGRTVRAEAVGRGVRLYLPEFHEHLVVVVEKG